MFVLKASLYWHMPGGNLPNIFPSTVPPSSKTVIMEKAGKVSRKEGKQAACILSHNAPSFYYSKLSFLCAHGHKGAALLIASNFKEKHKASIE